MLFPLPTRRQFLRRTSAGIVAGALPIGLSSKSAQSANLPTGQVRSVVIVLLSGGPSQLDTFDPKPDAPAGIRGEFSSIETATPGLRVCEHLPRLAHRSDRVAVVRSLSHTEHNHLLATHVALTGRPTPVPRGASDLDRVQSRTDFPNFAAALDYAKPRNDGVPSGVSLPNYLIEGPLTWPGQHAGFLGVRHDPWSINHDPNDPNFRVDSLSLREGVPADRLRTRRELLACLETTDAQRSSAAAGFESQQEAAFALLTSARVTDAFDIHREEAETRERYGRNKFGQSLLLTRRLVEAGVPIIQAAMGIVQTWDTHVDNWGRLKNTLLPQLDRGLEALLDDLESSGRLSETLVVVMGEFGRTPRISTLPGSDVPGRDHWAHVYSGLFAGGGVAGGQVIGQSDAIAGYPVSRAWSPADVGTTIFSALGVDPDIEILDPLGRPNRLQNGVVISPLYGS
ncbi:MAG: DUF1501 domain-containing protein [Planctomycetota bacterium]|nr:DUF1501 domain-containing protein [Planctomycetota bacterium]